MEFMHRCLDAEHGFCVRGMELMSIVSVTQYKNGWMGVRFAHWVDTSAVRKYVMPCGNGYVTQEERELYEKSRRESEMFFDNEFNPGISASESRAPGVVLTDPSGREDLWTRDLKWPDLSKANQNK